MKKTCFLRLTALILVFVFSFPVFYVGAASSPSTDLTAGLSKMEKTDFGWQFSSIAVLLFFFLFSIAHFAPNCYLFLKKGGKSIVNKPMAKKKHIKK